MRLSYPKVCEEPTNILKVAPAGTFIAKFDIKGVTVVYSLLIVKVPALVHPLAALITPGGPLTAVFLNQTSMVLEAVVLAVNMALLIPKIRIL